MQYHMIPSGTPAFPDLVLNLPITRPQRTHHDNELELLIVILNCQSLYDGAFMAIYLRFSRITVPTVATVAIRRRILLLRWRLWTFAP